MTDLHVHTHHSCDSGVTMDAYCREAVRKGIKGLCFTDHVDYNPADDGYEYYRAEAYFDEFTKAAERYGDRLLLLSGIEFSEPHIYPRKLEEYRKLPYDFILGSVHYWVDSRFPSRLVTDNYPVTEAFDKYWDEVLLAVQQGGFDSLAHPDFPKRYYKQNLWQEEKLSEIFSVMAAKGMALEINTSTLRQGLEETMPSRAIIEIFEKSGGRFITMGSDSHALNHLAFAFDKALGFVSGSLQNTVYIKHRAVAERAARI